ncbi:hypothetical protein [Thalassotalea profundi]|uniref:FTR1 family iron permease n=1 Tax=Thalassotalea profundi TaxID=2036687 RepID=A0ABQ3IDY3_9GAMM|nr:hypothetical protein [Thalassotalea profundi]GHE77308.1 hypothetical protein GCM10011501_00990 [Thalassotalea profundi]
MLINTVVLLLRDLLPVFVLLTFLRAFIVPDAFSYKNIRNVAITSFLFVLLIIQIVEPISEWFEGAGLELMQVSLIIMSFMLFLLITLLRIHRQNTNICIRLANIGLEVFIVVKTSNFFIFLHVYLQDKSQVFNVFIGVMLGIGICMSFSAIFYYLLKEWQETSLKTLLYIPWFLFLSGMISQVLALLAQVDIFSLSAPLWSSEHLIENSSEYGQLLSALIGYQSAPAREFLILYSIVFLGLVLLTAITHFFVKNRQGLPHE